jgi:hypothetical protein
MYDRGEIAMSPYRSLLVEVQENPADVAVSELLPCAQDGRIVDQLGQFLDLRAEQNT